MSTFKQILESVLDDISGEKSRPELESVSAEYLEVIQKIDNVKAQLEELYNTMITLEKKSLSTIATAVRSEAPKINMNLSQDGLELGDSCSTCSIKPESGVFKVETGYDTFAGNPLEILKHLMRAFVPEHKNGSGHMIIEGKRSTIVDLYKYKDSI